MFIQKWLSKLHGGNKNYNLDNPNQEIIPIHSNLEQNITSILGELGNSPDVIVRRFKIGNKIPVALIYTDGLVNATLISEFMNLLFTEYPEQTNQPVFYIIKEQLLNIGDVSDTTNQVEVIKAILRGSTAILIDGSHHTILASTQGWEQRSVTIPENQTVLRGPRQAFTENIRTNTAMLRRIIASPKLRFQQMTIGTLTETTVSVAYIDGIANEKIVEEVNRRLKKIITDGILDSGYIEEYIQDGTWSLFPTVYNSERPDVIAANLLEGKIAIFVDGSPFPLIVPVTFSMFFQAADDYYMRSAIGTLLRLLRITSFMIAMVLPSLYVAITTFHPDLLPTVLLIRLAAQREGVPFPAFVEAFLMEVTFEILREAGLRMPKVIGQAVSIVGALVLGTAAVDAGIVSAAIVIIVSMTAIASFTTPILDLAISARMIRFLLLMLAASFGLYGMLFGLMMIVIHLVSLRSFGIPYMNGIAPFNLSDQKDILMRVPLFMMWNRPRVISQQNRVRNQTDMPSPPKQDIQDGGVDER